MEKAVKTKETVVVREKAQLRHNHRLSTPKGWGSDKSCARELIKRCQLIAPPSCSNKPTLIDRTLELSTRQCYSRCLANPFSSLLLLALCHDKLLFLGKKIALRRVLIHETQLRPSR